jgi:hypothetical protein
LDLEAYEFARSLMVRKSMATGIVSHSAQSNGTRIQLPPALFDEIAELLAEILVSDLQSSLRRTDGPLLLPERNEEP